jgi:outer membrane protein assembly factor BamB
MIRQIKQWVLSVSIGLVAIFLVACSSTGDKPKPTELGPVTNVLAIRQAWSVPLSAGSPSFEFAVVGAEVVAAARDGTVLRIDAATGQVSARLQAGRALQSGVGADANFAAVVDTQNELLLLNRSGAVQWRARLGSQALAAPVFTREAVMVLTAEQNVVAFDLASGAKLWTNPRPAPGLLLNRAGGLSVVGDSLIANLAGGKGAAISAAGTTRWETSFSTARGANEVERLVDLVGKPAVEGADVCARSYQSGIACVTMANGRVRWQRKANGFTAVAADPQFVYGTESNGEVIALARDTGEVKWTVERFKFRDLSAPVALGRNLVFGDAQGFVHVLERADGANAARVSTDGSAISAPMAVAGQTLVVRTQNAIFGFLPQ